MSSKDLPITHFKVAVEELNHRYKVCLALSGLVEELVDIGNTTGKSLSKMGTQSFLTGQSQWLPTCSVALESIFKMTTATNGKQLVGFSTNLSQNVSKTFPEQVKAGKRRVAAVSTRISTAVDEYKKAKALHGKNLEKYQRMVTDTEAAIKAKYAASESEGRTASVDKDAVAISQGVAGDNFMNRSLNKMLSKIAPEKKLDDRCKDLVRELDATERALIVSGKRLLVQRSELIIDVNKAMGELEELETQRLTFMKEGLSRFCLAAELIANQQNETITTVLERTNKLDANAESVSLMNEIDRPLTINSPAAKKRQEVNNSDSDDDSSSGSELVTLFSKAEKLGEAMEYFKNLVARTAASLTEVAETEAGFSRSAQKVLDRHGYTRNTASQWVYAADYSTIPMLAEPAPVKSAPLSAAIGAVGATTLALTGGLRSAEFLSRFESPMTKAGWELVVSQLGNNADLMMRSSEVSVEDVSQQLELVIQRLEIGRKELVEKLMSNSKMVDNAKMEVNRISTKLLKCKAVLKERRETVKQVKEVMLSDSMEGSGGDAFANVVIAAVAQEAQNREMVGSPEGPSVLGATLEEPSAPSAAPAESAASSGGPFQRSKTSLFRKGGLKQVVGLETQADRASRIEKQVATLEEEQRELTESLAAAELSLAAITTAAKTQVLPIFDATREFLSTDLVTIKNAIECLMSWKSDSLASSKNFNRHVKKASEEIEIPKDVTAYIKAVQTAAEGIPKEQPAAVTLSTAGNAAAMASGLVGTPLSLLDVPEMEPFVPVSSELITQERALIASQQPAPSVYSISNLAMAAYSAGGADADGTSPPPSGYFNRIRRNTDDAAAGGLVSESTTSTADEDSIKSQTSVADATTPAGNNLAVTPAAGDSTERELAKFGLSANDKVIESYSCALYPKKGLLTHGRLFVTQHYAAFSGWPETRVLLLLRDIEEVNRVNTLYYVPNALSIVMKDRTEYFLGSFIDREQCYANLISLSDVGKHMATLQGYDESAELRSLEFGYQTCKNFFGGGEDAEVAASSASTDELASAVTGNAGPGTPMRSNSSPTPPVQKPERSVTPTRSSPAASPAKESSTPARVTAPTTPGPTLAPAAPATPAPAPAAMPAAAAPKEQTKPAVSTPAAAVPPSVSAPVVPPAAAPRAPAAPQPEPEAVDFDDGINLSTLFERCNISLMQEKVFSFSTTKLWNSCWLHGKGYGGFLLEEGELDVKYTEWVPLKNGSVPEDVAKLPYCCSRQFDYLHPRTTMLMFGPKNAPTNQTQYLYIPGGRKIDPMNSAALAAARPARVVVMTLTSFQGIPMCDVFKVLQFWSFERNAADHSRTEMRVGLAIHYMKTSMFKAQIYGGSKEELTVQSLKWLNYAEKCGQLVPAELATAFVEETETEIVEEETGRASQVRRSSLKRASSASIAQVFSAADEDAVVSPEPAVTFAPTVSAPVAPTAPTGPVLMDQSVASSSASAQHVTTQSEAHAHAPAKPSSAFVPAVQINVDATQLVVVLACAVLVLLILLYRESAHNSALIQQINLLSRKIEMSQTSMEISLRQSQAVVSKMEAFINTIQK